MWCVVCTFRRIDSIASVNLSPVPELQTEEHAEAATGVQQPQGSLFAVSTSLCLRNMNGER